MAGSRCDGCLGTRRCWVCQGTGQVEYGSGSVGCLRCDGTGICPLCSALSSLVTQREPTPVVLVDGDEVIVRPHGDQDIATADSFRRSMDEALSLGRPHIVIDLEEVKFIDVTCLGLVAVAAVRQRARGGDVAVVHLPNAARRAIQLLGHSELLSSPSDV